jgi:hypothetical protein
MKAVFKIFLLISLVLFSYELTKCTSDLDCKAENNEEKCEILEGETEGICLYKDENKTLYKRDERDDDSSDDSSYDDSYDDDSSSGNGSNNKDGNSKSNFIKYTIFTFACLFL